jgi:hypothetical protein
MVSHFEAFPRRWHDKNGRQGLAQRRGKLPAAKVVAEWTVSPENQWENTPSERIIVSADFFGANF